MCMNMILMDNLIYFKVIYQDKYSTIIFISKEKKDQNKISSFYFKIIIIIKKIYSLNLIFFSLFLHILFVFIPVLHTHKYNLIGHKLSPYISSLHSELLKFPLAILSNTKVKCFLNFEKSSIFSIFTWFSLISFFITTFKR